jgi:3-hydroxybutyryl-CoA dehydrogenase
MEINEIGILGAGIMGSGIAQVAAMSGYHVVVRDLKEEFLNKGRAKVEQSVKRMVKKGLLSEDKAKQLITSINWTTKVGDLSKTGLVIEAVPEDAENKMNMYQEMEKILDQNAIIASNTSSISISFLASAIPNPERFIGMHWFNPPVMMKLIEIVKGLETSEETVQKVVDICERMGKETIVCCDSQGFVTTRLLVAFRLECYRVYEEGIASKEDIDKACRLAFGHPMGQFELADFSGLDIELDILKGLIDAFGDRFRPPQRLVNLVKSGRIGQKSGHGWYDYG